MKPVAQLTWPVVRLLLCGSLCLCLGASLGCQRGGSLGSAQAQTDSKLTLSLGQFDSITGTPYLVAPATVTDVAESFFERIESSSSYDKKRGQIRNYLFFNSVDSANQWLLPHSKFLFVEWLELPLRPPAPNGKPNGLEKEKEPPKPTQLLYHELVKADTNSNKVFDQRDLKTIAISEVSGSNYQELIQDVDWVLHRSMTSEDDMRALFREEVKPRLAKFAEIGAYNQEI